MISIINNMPYASYHAVDALRSGQLKEFFKSPAHAMCPVKETPAMVLGRAFHTLTLEPHLFDAEYVEPPKVNRSTKVGKEEWAEWELNHQGLTILGSDELNLIRDWRDAVMASKTASGLINLCQKETSILWKDEETGVQCKARLDLWSPEKAIIADLKSAVDASPEGFAKAIANYGYHWSAAWYLEAATAATSLVHNTFVFIAVEKKPPHVVGIYTLDEEALYNARTAIREILPRYAECKKAESWPGLPDKVVQIQLPRWA